jgi:predicted membrane protein
MGVSSLLWGLLFGSIGLGFLIYGRKQRAVVPLICGLSLMIFPYFVSNTILLVVIGVVLMAIPYFLRY